MNSHHPRRNDLLASNSILPKEPLAIIGIGCRFPGASGPESFWQLIKNGVDAITEIPPDRFDINSVYDPTPGAPGKVAARCGGFLDKLDHFDASFFGISPREALRMDPQQRLLLEIAWEAFEDAGIAPDSVAGTRTGVFIGACTSDYEDIQYYHRDRSDIDFYVATGTARSVLSGRLSYTFDLLGPSMTVDTACSSSLVAVHLACQSLWNQECELALVGGVNLILLPEMSMTFSRASMLSPDGRCKFADRSANGFTRSEGAGLIVIKPLRLAQFDRNPIYSLIRGTAINNDGRSSGLLATPSRQGQEAVLRNAYNSAGISPDRVQYVEVHGTGTVVGDPVEVESLGAFLSAGRSRQNPCLIGSVKSNIGHTEGAAGIAGIIKAALSLKHKAIPPSLHFNNPNPNINWDELPLAVSQELTPWPDDSKPAVAGVSAFGISATNAHVVLEEAPAQRPFDQRPLASGNLAQILTLSARSPEALEALAEAYINAAFDEADLQNVCYTANVLRTHHDYRLALVGSCREEMTQGLKRFIARDSHKSLHAGHKLSDRKPKLVFIFPGQGSQWLGMGRNLLAEEGVFRAVINRSDEAFRKHVSWSLMEELLAADESRSRLNQIDVIQPCLFAIQIALAALWESWGIKPDAVVGQSMGEVAAAYVAGALSLEDAAQIICRRSLLLRRISGQGGMAVVSLSFEETRRALTGYENQLSIAVSSSPNSTVISGERAAIEEVIEMLESREVACYPIKVDVASHSPQVDPLRADLLRELEGINPRPSSVPLYSTVTGNALDGEALDAQYWCRNLRDTVLFSTTILRLIEEGHDAFLEISPHPVSSGPIQQSFEYAGKRGSVAVSMRSGEDERAVMLGALGVLYAAGYPVEWRMLYPKDCAFVRLPSYTWQRERFWKGANEPDLLGATGGTIARARQAPKGHLLCGAHLKPAAHLGTYYWEVDLSLDAFPYLSDHRVHGMAVLPSAAYIEMALKAAAEIFGAGPHELEDMSFKKALVIPDHGFQKLQLVVSCDLPQKASFQFFSLQTSDAEQGESWTLNATGSVSLAQSATSSQHRKQHSLEEIKAGCRQVLSREEHYDSLLARGLQYGSNFQGIDQLWRRDSESLGRISLKEEVKSQAALYEIHPALLDSCFQVLAASLRADQSTTYLPTGLARLRILDRSTPPVWSHALLDTIRETGSGVLKGNVHLLDVNGNVLIEALGLTLQPLEPDKKYAEQIISDCLYGIDWQPVEMTPQQSISPFKAKGAWIVFADTSGVGLELAESLKARGEACVIVSSGAAFHKSGPASYEIDASSPEDYSRLLNDIQDLAPCRGFVHLWSLDASPSEDLTLAGLNTAQAQGCGSLLMLVQVLAEAGRDLSGHLWLVTRGTQSAGSNVAEISISQSPLWGLARVLTHEHPELHCRIVDLNSKPEPNEVSMLFREIWSDSREEQIAFRSGNRYVARFVRQRLERASREAEAGCFDGHKEQSAEQTPFHLKTVTDGRLDGLTLEACERQRPGPGEVEIRVQAVGLNFRDVMLASGLLPSSSDAPPDFGWECAGTISAIGDGVDGFQVGDEVFAIASGCFSSFAVTSACLALPKPAHVSYEEAATIPIAFVTAYLGLRGMARLRAGERVLIHSATGGVGLAALEIARRSGAEIFATAGSDEKRRLLGSLGVKHVFDSRSLTFADEVMKATKGEGVDVVLNSLAGQAINAGLSILRTGGRFVELGRRDIYQNAQLGLRPFQKSLSFFAIDLALLIEQQPASIGSVFRETIEYLNDKLCSLPLQQFSISDAASAFRFMAQAKHTGKIVLTFKGETPKVEARAEDQTRFRSDGTYLITGGLGGLGLSVARWMVERGARHLVLMGRSDPQGSACEALEAIKSKAEVVIAKADVGQQAQVAKVIAAIESLMPPLRGIIHAAGLLDDGIILQQSNERFKRVMAPKVRGAWNLHTLTLNARLDFFVLFSSAASIIGSPGQGNYCAANAFLDALAYYRQSRGLPALSINWGPWSEVGLAARPDRGSRLALRGIGSLTPAQAIEAMDLLLRQRSPQVGVMPFDFEQWAVAYPSRRSSPLFANLIEREAASDPDDSGVMAMATTIRGQLLAADESEREKIMQDYLRERLAKVLGVSESKLSRLDVNLPMSRLGIDSLMAVEMKTLIRAEIGVEVPTLSFFRGYSLARLATEALNRFRADPSLRQTSNSEPLNNTRPGVEGDPRPNTFQSISRIVGHHWEELSI